MKACGILATDFELGSETITFEDLERRFGAEAMQKVLSGAGIRNRRVAAPGVCGSDLGFAAASRVLETHAIARDSIDLLIFCTQSPDYWMPTTACILHERLGLGRNCAAFDVNLGCSQYIYALSIAYSMLRAGTASRALVVTGDTMSNYVNPRDRAVVPLMGDAGSATLVGEVPEGQGFLQFELGTDGTGHRHLMIPAGGARIPISAETAIEQEDAEGNIRSKQNLFMNGVGIFHFAISTVPGAIRGVLEKASLTMDDIDLFLFHQANLYMLEYLMKKLKIPAAKMPFFVENIGNTSGSTIPLLLSNAWRAGRIRPGMKVLAIGFGVGLSWGATILQWPENALPAGQT